ncbi:GTP-binding protein ypt1 [Biomphalaria pfeifferi]|uniref:GTP-binding protein ypt1 n=1 Tax=Biomphalaria pfeifferi TaxID=112525 RepID=A0AAD8BP80_BIOPF|nr:GTP-binding protein ypt1 [Biomphalaria pfeifferi]
MLPELLHNTSDPKTVSPSAVSNFIFPSLSESKLVRHFSTGCDVYTSEHYDYVIKIILLGDQGVGKTSFIKALKVHPDVVKIQPKISSHLTADHLEVEINTSRGQKALVRLCDTGGQERYRSLTSSYYRGAHGVLLMYNVCNTKSLEHMELWLSDLDTFISNSSCAKLLVGTNCTSPQRTVLSSVARRYADSRDLPYAEIDSTHFYNVIESLKQLAELAIQDVTSTITTTSSTIRPSGKKEETTSPKFVCLC